MKKTIILVSAIALSGCGSFPLGTVYSIRGQSDGQREADVLYCKDWSHDKTETSERAVGSFLAGLTVIGAPVAISLAQERNRELFAQCLRERGYRVVPPAQTAQK